MPPTNRQMITQTMLAEMEELTSASKELERERERKRKELLELWQRGAPVERGPLRLRIWQQEYRRLSAKSLAQVIGDAEVERLQQLVEPTSTTYLRIEPSGA